MAAYTLWGLIQRGPRTSSTPHFATRLAKPRALSSWYTFWTAVTVFGLIFFGLPEPRLNTFSIHHIPGVPITLRSGKIACNPAKSGRVWHYGG